MTRKLIGIVGLLMAWNYTTAQWITQNIATSASFRGVHAVTEKTVWASGSKGTIIKTSDAGAKWEVFTVAGAEKLDFRDIHAFDSKHAVIISAGEASEGAAKVYRTADGGVTWSLVFETQEKGVFFDGIDFWNKNEGIIFSDPIESRWYILKTTDAGKTWNRIAPDNFALCKPNEAAFAASGTSMLTVGKQKAFICTGGTTIARVFKSEDLGQHWVAVDTPIPAGKTSGLFGMKFWDEQHGIAVGGDYLEVEKAVPNVAITQDGGKSWQLAQQTTPSGLKEGVDLYKKKILIAVGPSGTSFSSDFGKTWIMIDKSAFHAISINGSGIWAVGGKGNIAQLNTKILGQ